MIVIAGESLVDLVPSGPQHLSADCGGGPFNTARGLARLGQPVSFLGCISDDALGVHVRAQAGSGLHPQRAPRDSCWTAGPRSSSSGGEATAYVATTSPTWMLLRTLPHSPAPLAGVSVAACRSMRRSWQVVGLGLCGRARQGGFAGAAGGRSSGPRPAPRGPR